MVSIVVRKYIVGCERERNRKFHTLWREGGPEKWKAVRSGPRWQACFAIWDHSEAQTKINGSRFGTEVIRQVSPLTSPPNLSLKNYQGLKRWLIT